MTGEAGPGTLTRKLALNIGTLGREISRRSQGGRKFVCPGVKPGPCLLGYENGLEAGETDHFERSVIP